MRETQLSLVLYYEIALFCGMLTLESRPHTQSIHKKLPWYSLGGCGYYQADPKEHILYSISFTGILLKFFLPEEYSFVYENMNNIV